MTVRIQPTWRQDDHVHKPQGQFRLLVWLMMFFFMLGMGWTALIDIGKLKSVFVSETCFKMAEGLFLVALGMFRGMQDSVKPPKSKKLSELKE